MRNIDEVLRGRHDEVLAPFREQVAAGADPRSLFIVILAPDDGTIRVAAMRRDALERTLATAPPALEAMLQLGGVSGSAPVCVVTPANEWRAGLVSINGRPFTVGARPMA